MLPSSAETSLPKVSQRYVTFLPGSWLNTDVKTASLAGDGINMHWEPLGRRLALGTMSYVSLFVLYDNSIAMARLAG